MGDSSEVVDEALTILCDTGPEFGPGLSNHGPMAAEALYTLGREEAVIPWTEGYKRNLQDALTPGNPISGEEWRAALGDIKRVADWTVFFEQELEQASWQYVINTWTERFAPGMVSAATHGVIRTAHAVRNLGRGETKERLRELAHGLAYWAARYLTVPGLPNSGGSRLPSDAIADVPVQSVEDQHQLGLITHRLRRLDDESFGRVINMVDTSDRDAFLSDMTETFARAYLANVNDTNAIGLIHCVTGPSAVRLLLPRLTPDVADKACAHAWQAGAAIYAAFGQVPAPESIVNVTNVREDIIDQAVATQDEHAIKFTEACLREHDLHGSNVFLAAAVDASQRLRV
jgi:hypothetical protein